MNKYVISALVVIFLVFTLYFINFFVILGYGVSEDSARWGHLGDYVGGILNPILSFISIVLLIKSLAFQIEANETLRNEIKNKEKTEKLRSFETLFFNMINSQKELFDSFSIDFAQVGARDVKHKVNAVIAIEEEIDRLRSEESDDESIRSFLEKLDSEDQIFGLSRAFYIMVKIISDKLSDAEGFEYKDRKPHFLTLVNFTDFAQLRLIMIGIQFMNYHSSVYLKNNQEFKAILEELDIGYNLY